MHTVTLILSLAFAFAMLALSIALVGWSVRETLDIKRKPRTPRDTVRHSRTHAQRASLTAQDMRAEQAIADAIARAHEAELHRKTVEMFG